MTFLDNASTTQPKFTSSSWSFFFNTNTPYAITENKYLLDCEKRIKALLGVKDGVVIFPRCATEAAQWLAHKIACVMAVPWSHDSVYDEMHWTNGGSLMRMFQLTNPVVGREHTFDFDTPNKGVTGANEKVTFNALDITASIGHTSLTEVSQFDCAFWSGHKFHAEKGIGGLWIGDKLLKFLGGTKDPANGHGLLHGTVNLPGIMAMTDAMEKAVNNTAQNRKMWAERLKQLCNELKAKGIKYKIMGRERKDYTYTPAINLLYLPGLNADALQQYLASKEIYVGLAASACAGSHDYRVATVLGIKDEEARQSIRVSFSEDTTENDITTLVVGINEFKEKFV